MRFSSKTFKNRRRRNKKGHSQGQPPAGRQERGKRISEWVVASVLSLAASVPAEEAKLLNDLQAYFATYDEANKGDAETRQKLVESMLANEVFDPAEVHGWLHQLDLWAPIKPGRYGSKLAVGYGHERPLTIRVPKDYTPTKAWPVLYAFHPSGGTGPSYIGRVESLLGPRVEQYLIVAPTNYRQTILDAPPPFTPEHPVILQDFRKTFHVDADRTYVIGYSTGGYTSWTLAALHADELGGAVPMASAYSFPADVEGLWEAITVNFAHLPILHIWGDRDSLTVPGFEMRDHNVGTISSLNKRFSPIVQKLKLDHVIDARINGAGHGGLRVPKDDLHRVLTNERPHYPKKVEKLFRHIHQARAYWLEGHEWVGDHWGEPGRRIKAQRGESFAQAAARVVMPLMGKLKGEVDGQTLRVQRQNIGEMTVWIGDGMIDFDKPVRLEVDGRKVFEGLVKRDLAVCLAEAARTRDFDRLRWAGLRVAADGRTQPVTAKTEFPPLIRVP